MFIKDANICENNKKIGGKQQNESTQRPWFYPHRAPRRDCDYRNSGGYAAPRPELCT